MEEANRHGDGVTEEEQLLLEIIDKDVLEKLLEDPEVEGLLDAVNEELQEPSEAVEHVMEQRSSSNIIGQETLGTSSSEDERFATSPNDGVGAFKHLAEKQFKDADDPHQCPVCEDGRIGRHTYYGGRSCHSCRGFFRRSVQSGHWRLFRCKTGDRGNCTVLSRTRQSCQSCRFRRCLNLGGLKPELVLTGEERRLRLIKRSYSKRKGFCTSTADVDTRFLTFALTKDEEQQLHSLFHTLLDHNHQRMLDFFSRKGHVGLAQSFVDAMAMRRRFSKTLLRATFELDIQSAKNYAFGLPEMSGLSPSDRITLVASNSRSVAGLGWIWFQDNQEFYFRHMVEHGRRKDREATSSEYGARHLLEELDKALDNNSASSDDILDKSSISAPYDAGHRGAHLLKSEITQSLMAPSSAAWAEVVLLLSAMLFCPDSVDGGNVVLEDEERVRNEWRKHMKALERYNRSKENAQPFERIVRAISTGATKTFFDIHMNEILID